METITVNQIAEWLPAQMKEAERNGIKASLSGENGCLLLGYGYLEDGAFCLELERVIDKDSLNYDIFAECLVEGGSNETVSDALDKWFASRKASQ